MASLKSIKQDSIPAQRAIDKYSSLDSLPASPLAGDMAYFDSDGSAGTDSLYVSDGGGWYKISFDSASS